MENLNNNVVKIFDNKFIELFEDLYDKLYMSENKEIEQPKEEPVKITFFGEIYKYRSRKAEPEEKPPKSEASISYDNLKSYLNDILSNKSQSFWTLWSYCQFIRWAEKVFLYENDPKYDLFVDSAMDADERCLMFNYEDSIIQIKLQLVKKPEINLLESAYNEVVTILIQRQYGKKIVSKYVSVDGITDLADDSDIYTLNQINRFLNIKMRESFAKIICKMLNKWGLGADNLIKRDDILNRDLEYICNYYE